MLKAVEEISPTKRRIEIEIPADTIEKEISETLENLRKRAKIPGFRAGKAPINLIEKRFAKEIEDDVVERIIPQAYAEVLEKTDIIPVADPIVEKQTEVKRNRPLSLTFLIEVLPKVELSYEGIKVKDIPLDITDEDVENVLQRLREEKTTYEPSDEPIGMNDLILCDYSIAEPAIERKNIIYKVGGSLFPEDVVKELIGKEKGSELNVTTTFSDDYHYNEEVAGKKVELKLVIKDIKRNNPPKLDDDFAKDLGFNNLEELKGHIKEKLIRLKEDEVVKFQKAEIAKQLLETHDFELPESLLEEEIEFLMFLKNNDGDNIDDETIKKIREEVRPVAAEKLKLSLLISMIGKKEGIQVSGEELNSAVNKLAQRLSLSTERIIRFYMERYGSLDRLKNAIFEEKVLDLLLSKAVIEKGGGVN